MPADDVEPVVVLARDDAVRYRPIRRGLQRQQGQQQRQGP